MAQHMGRCHYLFRPRCLPTPPCLGLDRFRILQPLRNNCFNLECRHGLLWQRGMQKLISITYRFYRLKPNEQFFRALKIIRDRKDLIEHTEEVLFDLELSKYEIFETLNHLEDELEYLSKINAKVIWPSHDDYPDLLEWLEQPPVFLSYLGQPTWQTHPMIGVVGTREPTNEALQWMSTELYEFLKNGIATVSGAARGVDQKAHRMTLLAEQPTVAFLPAGLKNPYPNEFKFDFEYWTQFGGSIVSEYLPSMEIRKHHFQERNRLIAALGQFLLVVQSQIKSGTLLTAKHAIELGRPVSALPWSALDYRGTGNNLLLHDGANLIRDRSDLMTLFQVTKVIYSNDSNSWLRSSSDSVFVPGSAGSGST